MKYRERREDLVSELLKSGISNYPDQEISDWEIAIIQNVSPNPVSISSINLLFELLEDGNCGMDIYSVQGAKIFSYKFGYLSKGEHNNQLQLPDLVSDIYYITLNHNSIISDSRKIIVL